MLLKWQNRCFTCLKLCMQSYSITEHMIPNRSLQEKSLNKTSPKLLCHSFIQVSMAKLAKKQYLILLICNYFILVLTFFMVWWENRIKRQVRVKRVLVTDVCLIQNRLGHQFFDKFDCPNPDLSLQNNLNQPSLQKFKDINNKIMIYRSIFLLLYLLYVCLYVKHVRQLVQIDQLKTQLKICLYKTKIDNKQLAILYF